MDGKTLPQDRPLIVALVGSYVPRQCGIATFTKDLRDAVAAEVGQRQAWVAAVDDGLRDYAYPEEVRHVLPAADAAAYLHAARVMNSGADVAVIQHEFGIYGGKSGWHILDLLAALHIPKIVTLHTVLDAPTPSQAAITAEVCRLGDRVVAMSGRGCHMLTNIYQAPRSKIACIPHGIPDMPLVNSTLPKQQFVKGGVKPWRGAG